MKIHDLWADGLLLHTGATLRDGRRKSHENITSVLSSDQKSYRELGIIRNLRTK